MSSSSPTWAVDGWVGNDLDESGVLWTVETEEGWSSSPPVRGDVTSREAADGAYDSAERYYDARLVTLTGFADAPSQAAMLAAKERLLAVGSDLRGPLLELAVGELTGTRSAWVRRATDTKTTDQGSRAFAWQLNLLAPDPRKYGAPAAAAAGLPAAAGGMVFPVTFPLTFPGGGGGGSLLATNAGRYETWPTLRIVGPATDPVAENLTTGKRFRLAPLTLGTGDYVDVDMDARTVLLNGSASRRAAVAADSDWWSLAPGDNAVRFGAAAYDPAAQLQLTWRPAWI